MTYHVTGQLFTPTGVTIPVDTTVQADGIIAAGESALWQVCAERFIRPETVGWYGAPVVREVENVTT